MKKPGNAPLLVGNWKMNGLRASLGEASGLKDRLIEDPARAQVAICPPFTLLSELSSLLANSPIRTGAQDCYSAEKGAHTGDISAEMLADSGANFVIVGHSERRSDHGETSDMVRQKAQAVYRAGLTAIICVGETLKEREIGKAEETVLQQVKESVPAEMAPSHMVIAYEPVWAIGTGKTATPDDIKNMHAAIRRQLLALDKHYSGVPILYGGSVKPDNAARLLTIDEVGGALVGGASLKAHDFEAIIRAT